MTRPLIKVCGIRTADALSAAIDAGADAVGFVFATSPRQVDPDTAATLAARCPPNVRRAGVFLHPAAETVAAVVSRVPLDWLQSDADDQPAIDRGLQLARDSAHSSAAPPIFVPVFRDGPDLAARLDLERRAARDRLILIEGPRSGAGVAPDWSRVRAAATGLCFILAGGLNPRNVARAVADVNPAGVDVSSGVESAPGLKDPLAIAAFIAAARIAQ